METFKRSLGTVFALALFTVSCGGTDTSVSSTASGDLDESSSSAAAGDPIAYCAELENMFALQPSGIFTASQSETELAAYAAAIELAATSAPGDQAAALVDLADFVRGLGADPTAEGTLERAIAMIGPMLEVQTYAEDECGLVVEDTGDVAGTAEAPPVRADAEIEPGSIEDANSAVPAEIELTFETIQTPNEEYPVLAVVPIGWQMSESFGFTFEPPEGSELGFFTEFRVSDGCDGICIPQDWSVIMDDLESGPFAVTAGEGTVLLDKTLSAPTGRLVVYADPDAFNPVVVVATRWSERADRYFKCEAQLDDGDEALWPALAAACEASIALWIPVE